jgi:hypothetical protein
MNGSQYAKLQFDQGMGLLKAVMAGTTPEQYAYKPAGTANAIDKTHVHALTSVDFFIVNMVKGDQILWPEFATKHGLPANPLEIWGHQGAIPMDAVTEYGARLVKLASEYIGSLSDADLDRQLETQFFGIQSVGYMIQLAAMHCVGHAGDMAAIKGIQGVKGLPF